MEKNVSTYDNHKLSLLEQSQTVLYHPDESTFLEVKVDCDHDTVWLSTVQIAQLFGKSESCVRRHIRNIFSEGELERDNSEYLLQIFGIKKPVTFYNLEVIMSVGYRVRSHHVVSFRRWAVQTLRYSHLNDHSINCQLVAIQERLGNRISEWEKKVAANTRQLESFVKTNIIPAEQVFFEGDFYTARVALETLIKSALNRVILVDAYISAITLDVLDVRCEGVEAVIYTGGVGVGIQRLMEEHDKLFPDNHIDIRKWRKESHDRWLIIDDRIYHCGHSLNAYGGHKISAIALMCISPDVILSEME